MQNNDIKIKTFAVPLNAVDVLLHDTYVNRFCKDKVVHEIRTQTTPNSETLLTTILYYDKADEVIKFSQDKEER